MREIKFRAWDKENKIMKSWEDFMSYPSSLLLDIMISMSYPSLYANGEPRNSILQQFTGLKDKNGKEIYDGDILGGIFKSCYVSWCDKCKSFQVINCLQECMACEGGVHWFEIISDKDIEVIGNIFENPNLLTHK